MPGVVKRGAGDSLGPCDARYLQGNEAAKDWLVRFMTVSRCVMLYKSLCRAVHFCGDGASSCSAVRR